MTISAKIIADSISPSNARLTTFELEYPRFIHAELMTHRLFSRNAASSRAIPVAKAIELIQENTARPIHWGKNQPGMSAKEECDTHHIIVDRSGRILIDWSREVIWNAARDAAISFAKIFDKLGYHKQIVNRLLEPFTHIKVVVTATEYDNFFWLRRHPDAQPEIQKLADEMWGAMSASRPVALQHGDWHTPYFGDGHWFIGIDHPSRTLDYPSLEDAIAISSSCCAQVSYRKLDDSVEKARDIYKRLVESTPVHASPFEHQGTPMHFATSRSVLRNGFHSLREGLTHLDMKDNYWSGNFRGWIQNRQLIENNVCQEYKPE